jgi:hypothetical protein
MKLIHDDPTCLAEAKNLWLTRFTHAKAMIKALLLSFLLTLPVLLAQVEPQPSTYEVLQPVSAADFVPASQFASALYTVAPVAQPDGLHLTYTLQGPDGAEYVTGTQSLVVRTNEIKAIVALDEINNSEEFGKALVKAGTEKVDSVKEAVKDPLGTVQRLPQGASRLLGRVGTAIKNTAEGKGNPRAGAEAVLGVSRKKSELAIQLGVSPYTRNARLQEKLDATARAMAGGALVVNLSGLLVSGGVGTAISVVNVNQTLQRTLIESTPEEMTAKNRAALTALGTSPSEVAGFLSNTSFSPWQKTIVTADLKDIGRNPGPFLRLASKANTQEQVLDLMQVAHILRKHHQDSAALVSFREEAGVLAALDSQGVLVAPVAGDLMLWMEPTESRANTLRKMAQDDSNVKSLALATDGVLSARAVDEFTKRGIVTIPQALGPIR